ncbi:hypothetical protein D1BOALGB6SA_8543 [Olavius sp. associated proteobacterium Delta 1]|nr:hypothetical protein D1BOALGB6SA_8543 [Olavius sp. associated proteobacterium Delta 1]
MVFLPYLFKHCGFSMAHARQLNKSLKFVLESTFALSCILTILS